VRAGRGRERDGGWRGESAEAKTSPGRQNIRAAIVAARQRNVVFIAIHRRNRQKSEFLRSLQRINIECRFARMPLSRMAAGAIRARLCNFADRRENRSAGCVGFHSACRR